MICSNESKTWFLNFRSSTSYPFLRGSTTTNDMKVHHDKRGRLWWNKHGSCVPLKVCVQEQEGEQSRKCERRCASAVPRAFCSMYSAHSSQSSFLQSQGCVPTCRASQQHGASTWPCQLPGPVAWVDKVSYKTNTGVTLAMGIKICEFMQGNSEGAGICAADFAAWEALLVQGVSSVKRHTKDNWIHVWEMDIRLQNTF